MIVGLRDDPPVLMGLRLHNEGEAGSGSYTASSACGKCLHMHRCTSPARPGLEVVVDQSKRRCDHQSSYQTWGTLTQFPFSASMTQILPICSKREPVGPSPISPYQVLHSMRLAPPSHFTSWRASFSSNCARYCCVKMPHQCTSECSLIALQLHR
jgi:hypothetical protein